jgi:type VI secretion system secreted protein VgrG
MALSVTITLRSEDRDGLALAFEIVTKVRLRAALSRLFEIVLEVHHPDPALDLDAIVGRSSFIDFPAEPFLKKLDGIVREARQLTAEPSFVSVYELTIVPSHWLLTQRRDCRIFQDQTTPEILLSVLREYGMAIQGKPVATLLDEPESREYCVQYDETDHDFVFRVLAEDGLVWLFNHHQGKGAAGEARSTEADDVWIVDDTRQQPRHCTVAYNPSANLSTGVSQAAGRTAPEVHHVELTSGVRTSRVTLADYNYENPMHVLREGASVKQLPASEAPLEAHTYEVGRYREEKAGRAAAERDLQATRATRRTYRCKSSFLLAPGTRFLLEHSPWGDLDLLVVECESTATFQQSTSKSHVDHTLSCIRADTPYRPRRSPKPRILGTQTAFVVGKQVGQDEIDVDAVGRVKVHFNWDRRQSSFQGKPTRFIRVSQPWAGQGHGMTLVPRVGDELVVAFLDGDPDEPIVVGRVHNPVYPDPLSLSDPNQHTVSTWKSKSSPRDPSSDEDRFNLVMMQDKSGEELLKLRAQRDFEHDTLHDSRTEVGHNQNIHVVGGQSTSAGSVSISSGSTITETAATRFSMDAGANMFLHAKEGLSQVSDTTVDIAAGTEMNVSSGTVMNVAAGSKIEMASPTFYVRGGVVSVHGGKLYLHGTGGAHLSAATEVVVVGGTVNIRAAGGTVNVSGSEINLNC